MKIKSCLFLLLCTVISSPLLAQSNTVHFQGRIIAPVCNDAVSAETRHALASGQTHSVTSSTLDLHQCGGMPGTVIAKTSLSSAQRPDPLAPRVDTTTSAGPSGYQPDRVWTVTYQ